MTGFLRTKLIWVKRLTGEHRKINGPFNDVLCSKTDHLASFTHFILLNFHFNSHIEI